jgi:hypothetical protein
MQSGTKGQTRKPPAKCGPDGIPVMECPEVVFAHAVNTRDAVVAALEDPFVNFLEADVIAGPATPGTRFSEPLMGHDPGHPTDLSFKDWLALVAGKGTLQAPAQTWFYTGYLLIAGKGIKVDIKEWAAVNGVLHYLEETNESIKEVRYSCDKTNLCQHVRQPI